MFTVCPQESWGARACRTLARAPVETGVLELARNLRHLAAFPCKKEANKHGAVMAQGGKQGKPLLTTEAQDHTGMHSMNKEPPL